MEKKNLILKNTNQVFKVLWYLDKNDLEKVKLITSERTLNRIKDCYYNKKCEIYAHEKLIELYEKLKSILTENELEDFIFKTDAQELDFLCKIIFHNHFSIKNFTDQSRKTKSILLKYENFLSKIDSKIVEDLFERLNKEYKKRYKEKIKNKKITVKKSKKESNKTLTKKVNSLNSANSKRILNKKEKNKKVHILIFSEPRSETIIKLKDYFEKDKK